MLFLSFCFNLLAYLLFTFLMENKIYEPTEKFDFTKLTLATPVLSGGNYYIKFAINGNDVLYIQAPKCITKHGIVKSGKKLYCDLAFSNIDEQFIQWIEHLEKYSQEYIFKNREKWFESELELEDIENSFSSSLKIYKSGKQYTLRTNIPSHLGKCALNVFNEDETEFNIDEFKETTNVISILEIQGIKCSPKNFQIDFEIKQMMVLKPSILFNKCVIQHTHPGIIENNSDIDVIENSNIYNKKEEEENSKKDEENDNIEQNIDTTEKQQHTNEEDTDEDTNTDTDEDDELSKKLKIVEMTDIEKKDIEYLGNIKQLPEEDDNIIEEVDFNLDNDEPPIYLKDKSDVYYEIYKEAFEKAKENRILAISTYFNNNSIQNIKVIVDLLKNNENDE